MMKKCCNIFDCISNPLKVIFCLGSIAIGILFIILGLQKLLDYSATVEWLTSREYMLSQSIVIPHIIVKIFAYIIPVAELLGGILVLTRVYSYFGYILLFKTLILLQIGTALLGDFTVTALIFGYMIFVAFMIFLAPYAIDIFPGLKFWKKDKDLDEEDDFCCAEDEMCCDGNDPECCGGKDESCCGKKGEGCCSADKEEKEDGECCGHNHKM